MVLTFQGKARSCSARFPAVLLLTIGIATASFAHDDPTKGRDPDGDHNTNHYVPEHGSLAKIGAKLADPTSNVWALQFNVQAPTFSDGDLNTGNPKAGGNVIFQPVLPIPLYGEGEDQWKLLTRPSSRSSSANPSRRASTSSTISAAWGTSRFPCC